MKDQNPIRTARRRAQRQERERQGTAVSPCILCIHEHHTVGRQHDPKLTDPLCEKHHREIHEQMRQACISLTFEPDRVKRVATALRSAALYDRARADAMERWAELLEEGEEDQVKGINGERVESNQESLDLIMTMILTKAWPVWERYNGDVPSDELRKFDEEGDFPRGVAAAAMTRLSRDKELREQFRDFCAREALVRNEERQQGS